MSLLEQSEAGIGLAEGASEELLGQLSCHLFPLLKSFLPSGGLSLSAEDHLLELILQILFEATD